jgi:hypothetical protein
MRVRIDDGELVEAAFARLPGGMGEMLRGVERLDGEDVRPA